MEAAEALGDLVEGVHGASAAEANAPVVEVGREVADREDDGEVVLAQGGLDVLVSAPACYHVVALEEACDRSHDPALGGLMKDVRVPKLLVNHDPQGLHHLSAVYFHRQGEALALVARRLMHVQVRKPAIPCLLLGPVSKCHGIAVFQQALLPRRKTCRCDSGMTPTVAWRSELH